MNEEIKEIEKNFKGTIRQHALAVAHLQDYQSQSSQSESEAELTDTEKEKGNKPVAVKTKTTIERNKKVSLS